MFTSYFTTYQIVVLVLAGLFHLASIVYFSFGKNVRNALLILFGAGLVTRLGIINFDQFLHLWDEQFHALVAKNLAENPFTPMLFKRTPLAFDPAAWNANHIWLHKQPWFLWQMALSIKIFGATPFAVRLPSAIMTSLLILVIYRIGKLTVNERAGYLGAFLYAVCNYLLDFNTGQYCTDHNDIAFIFYVTLSIWVYTEYRFNKNSRYIWLIGIFAGIAILNKWLTGLLVFSGWGITLLFIKETPSKISELKDLLKALGICLVVFIPWQIYTFLRFPLESQIEHAFSNRHFFEAIEGHTGDVWFHFEETKLIYGILASYFLIPALVVLFFEIKDQYIRIGYIVFVTIVYLFFTVAQTKMTAFCLIVSPIFFLALGTILNKALEYFHKQKIKGVIVSSMECIVILVLGAASFDIDALQANHTNWITGDARAMVTHNKLQARRIGEEIAGKYDEAKTIVITCKEHDNIPITFFSGYTAYDRMPTEEECRQLKERGYKLLYVDNFSPIPGYLANDRSTVLLDAESGDYHAFLRTLDGKCLEVNENGSVYAGTANLDRPGLVRIQHLKDDKYALCTLKDKYWSAELATDGKISSTRDYVSDWETFQLAWNQDSLVSFKAANGKYLSISDSLRIMYANADTIGKFEKFEMIPTQ